MVFEGRALDEISDAEIANLVDAHTPEQQDLEFKATFENRKSPARMELLRDIVAMANGGGGYLIIGIHDDGCGRADRFAESRLMSNSESMIQSIRSLCHDHIAERIEGIEIRGRNVTGNTVILVRIPISARRPHMVTRDRRTDFVVRVEDGKREMSLAEIREAFVNEPTGMRLDSMDARLSHLVRVLGYDQRKKELTEISQAHVSDALARLDDGRLLADFMRERFETEVGESPFLWLGATPVTPRQHLIEVDEPDIISMLSTPPGSRRSGWNMAGLDHSHQRSLTGVELGTKGYEYLEVFENGHLEFWTPLDDHFCWRQSEEERKVRPRLYPYPVVEYPVSFLRLAEALLGGAGYSEEIMIQLEYRNAAGYILRPGQPGHFDFDSPLVGSTPFAGPHLLVGPIRVPGTPTFQPDEVALYVLKVVYRAFGIGAEGIPFRDSDGTFSFGE